MEKQDINRRDFLKLSLVGGGAVAGLQLASRSTATAGSVHAGKHSWAMVIDQAKCTGCEQCTLTCQAHNDIHPDITWNKVRQTGKIGDQEVYLPTPCMHCEVAPCVDVCPVGASYYRDDGIVMMDYDRCIGCRYCQVACPYGARSFNWETFTGENPAVPDWGDPDIERRPRGVVEKCSFCYQHIDRGLAEGLTPGVDREATPACVQACPTGARIFGDLNDPESPVSQALSNNPSFRLREELGTGPRVYYLPPSGQSKEAGA